MVDYNRLNQEMLPRIEKRLSEIRAMQAGDRYNAITDMIANMSLSPDEKIKLRVRLFAEFGFAPIDFNEAFGCRFSLYMYEHVGRGR